MGLIIKILFHRKRNFNYEISQINKEKKFAVAIFDPEYKAFVIHIAIFSINLGNRVHLSRKIQIAYLKTDKVPTKIFSKYADFADIFSPKLVTKLLAHIRINNYIIEVVDNGQPPNDSIYSLDQVELETLKIYINQNLTNSFIRPSQVFYWSSYFL